MSADRCSLTSRHLEDWDAFRLAHLKPCLDTGDEGSARFVKTLADILRITQDAERRILLFSEGITDDGPCEVEWGG